MQYFFNTFIELDVLLFSRLITIVISYFILLTVIVLNYALNICYRLSILPYDVHIFNNSLY